MTHSSLNKNIGGGKKKKKKITYRYQFPVRDLPFDAGFFAVPVLFLHKLAVLQSHHGLRGQQRTDKPGHPRTLRHRDGPGCVRTNPRLPVVGGRLIEWLVEFELDFGVFEGALRLHAHSPLVVHAEHQIGFGSIAHLSGCEPNTCRKTLMHE